MTTQADIIAQRDAAIAILNAQIVAANDMRNEGATGMDDKINSLEQQKTAITAQAYQGALDDPAMTQALATLKAATQDMTDVAKNMVSATTFLSNFAGFVAAANKVIPILKGIA